MLQHSEMALKHNASGIKQWQLQQLTPSVRQLPPSHCCQKFALLLAGSLSGRACLCVQPQSEGGRVRYWRGEEQLARLPPVVLLLLSSLILQCSHSPLVKLIKNFMPHAATRLLRVCCCVQHAPPPDPSPSPSAATAPCPRVVCYVRGRVVALSRCCLHFKLRSPKLFSDFVLGLFADSPNWLATATYMARTCNLQLAARSLLCPAARPDQARPDQTRPGQSSLDTRAQTSCEVFNKFARSCFLSKGAGKYLI